MNEQNITEQNVPVGKEWLDEEVKNIEENQVEYEKLPALKFEENKVTVVNAIMEQPFQKHTSASLSDPQKNVTKAIIPCTVDGVKHNWWLNIQNPLYADIIHGLREGKNNFEIMRTGKMKETKYVLLKK